MHHILSCDPPPRGHTLFSKLSGSKYSAFEDLDNDRLLFKLVVYDCALCNIVCTLSLSVLLLCAGVNPISEHLITTLFVL